MSNASTVRSWRSRVEELPRRNGHRSAAIRDQQILHEAALVASRVMPRARKTYGGITGKALSNVRQTGGIVGRVAVLLYHNPDEAGELLAFLERWATAGRVQTMLSVEALVHRAQRDDSQEDDARTAMLLDPTPATIRAYLDASDAVDASLADVRLALMQALDR